MQEKKVSSCIMIFDPVKRTVIAEHPTGRKWKDKVGNAAKGVFSLPKGEIDEGEDKVAAAIREVKEETGLDLERSKLKYLGFYKYIEYKDLEMFYYEMKDVDLKTLKCESYFEAPNGKMLPEVNGFCNLCIDTEIDMFFFSMQKVMKKCIEDWPEYFEESSSVIKENFEFERVPENRLTENEDEDPTELLHKICWAISDWSLLFQKYLQSIRPFWKLDESRAGNMQLRALQQKTEEIYSMSVRLKNGLNNSHLVPKEIKGELFTISKSIVPEVLRIYSLVFKDKETYDDKDRENVHKEVFKFKEVYEILRIIIDQYNEKWKMTEYTVENLKELELS
jgi:predicted NUDIX family NTP pyrophosphohydrolase